METTVLYSTLCTPGKATNTLIPLYMIPNSFIAHYPILSYASLTNNYCFRCAECNHVPTVSCCQLQHLAEMASVDSSMYSFAILLLRKAT